VEDVEFSNAADGLAFKSIASPRIKCAQIEDSDSTGVDTNTVPTLALYLLAVDKRSSVK